MDAYAHASGQVEPAVLDVDAATGQPVTTPADTTTVSQPAVSAPPAVQHAGSFISQLPKTIPWWGWALGGAALGYVIGSRR